MLKTITNIYKIVETSNETNPFQNPFFKPINDLIKTIKAIMPIAMFKINVIFCSSTI